MDPQLSLCKTYSDKFDKMVKTCWAARLVSLPASSYKQGGPDQSARHCKMFRKMQQIRKAIDKPIQISKTLGVFTIISRTSIKMLIALQIFNLHLQSCD
ncbi:hypothetical protein T07_12741 [Trichinella nelsoni]|uniref:Uncharacterized protein n=1 Tax=Trichinella nelsoni TaxID=6336 RepID=A0A0V0S7E8_9BILA|nr:hypothetical protein T07_12741 [Trichinella nelsoni]